MKEIVGEETGGGGGGGEGGRPLTARNWLPTRSPSQSNGTTPRQRR